MGLLDGVFAGAGGLSAMLHDLLGGSATILVKSFVRDEATLDVYETFEKFPVAFVPSDSRRENVALNAPSASRSDVREPSDILSGTFPCASLSAPIKAGRDSIVYGGIEYLIETVETLQVGDSDVQCSITARRLRTAEPASSTTPAQTDEPTSATDGD